MGEAVDQSFSQMAPADIHALVAYLRSVPPIASSDLPATLAPPASGFAQGGRQSRGQLWQAGIRRAPASAAMAGPASAPSRPMPPSPAPARVNDPTATNVAQIVISGTTRSHAAGHHLDAGIWRAYSDTEIAAVANYVTARFGSEQSNIIAKDVAELREQTSH